MMQIKRRTTQRQLRIPAAAPHERYHTNFYAQPFAGSAYVLVAYNNSGYASHSGLGVSANHTVRVLRNYQVRADKVAVTGDREIRDFLDAHLNDTTPVTHVIVEAPFLSTAQFQGLTDSYPDVHFIMRIHSQVAFLQVEAGAVRLIREQIEFQEVALNFTVSANSTRIANELRVAYNSTCLYLPNLYFLDRGFIRRRRVPTETLKIGCFGALRLLKNPASAAMAALIIAQKWDSDLLFHINTNRVEHGQGVLQVIRNLFERVPYATLVEVPWADVPGFRRTVATMDLCMQPSLTETFNIVTADAAAEGIPSVVGHSIEWVPSYWQADVDDCDDIARVGMQLLADPTSGEDGIAALAAYEDAAIDVWLNYLSDQPTTPNHSVVSLGARSRVPKVA